MTIVNKNFALKFMFLITTLAGNYVSAQGERSTTLWGIFGPVVLEGAHALASGIKSGAFDCAKAPYIYARNNPKHVVIATAFCYAGYLANQGWKLHRLFREIDREREQKRDSAYWALENNDDNQATFVKSEGSRQKVNIAQNNIDSLQEQLHQYTSIPCNSLNDDLNWQWDGLTTPGRYVVNSACILGRIMHALYKPFKQIAAKKNESIEETQDSLRNLQAEINRPLK